MKYRIETEIRAGGVRAVVRDRYGRELYRTRRFPRGGLGEAVDRAEEWVEESLAGTGVFAKPARYDFESGFCLRCGMSGVGGDPCRRCVAEAKLRIALDRWGEAAERAETDETEEAERSLAATYERARDALRLLYGVDLDTDPGYSASLFEFGKATAVDCVRNARALLAARFGFES